MASVPPTLSHVHPSPVCVCVCACVCVIQMFPILWHMPRLQRDEIRFPWQLMPHLKLMLREHLCMHASAHTSLCISSNAPVWLCRGTCMWFADENRTLKCLQRVPFLTVRRRYLVVNAAWATTTVQSEQGKACFLAQSHLGSQQET